MSDFEKEPVKGLPTFLPEGERVLWQGAPRAWPLARRAMLIGPILVYFGALGLWRFLEAMSLGAAPVAAIGHVLPLIPVAAATIGILALMARWIARTTLYTITNRRVVLRFGIALPMAVNLPFKEIGSADLQKHRDGTGTIALAMTSPSRLAFLHLWPNVRPWHFARTRPALRAVAEPEAAATILAEALREHHGQLVATTTPAEAPSAQPVPGSMVPAE